MGAATLTPYAKQILAQMHAALGLAPGSPVYQGEGPQYAALQAAQAQQAQAEAAPPPSVPDPGAGAPGATGGAGVARFDPSTDPAYQNLLAQLGLQESTYRNQATSRIGQIGTELGVALPRIAESGIEARRGINGNAESRGIFRSGERLRGLAIQQRGEQERVADAQRAAATQIGNVNMTLDQQIVDLARQRAQAALTGAMA